MSRWRVSVLSLVVAVAASVVPSAGAESAVPVCAVSWNPTGGNRAELWLRCSTPAPVTDVRVGFWWKNAWNMSFATAHVATTWFDASPTTVEWKVGSVDFGSTKPFDNTATPVDVMIDGRWQRSTITSFDKATPLAEPVLATDDTPAVPAPAPLAAARCAVSWNPTGFNRAELWVRCATAVRATDVRVGYWWQNTWNTTFATGHASTQQFETSTAGLEWKVGAVDFGSTRPFDGTATPIQVLIDGQWLPAAVATFARATPLADPGTPADGPGIRDLRQLRARIADVSEACAQVPPDATGIKVTIDIAAGTCLVEATVTECAGIEFFCDHHDTLVYGIAGTATAVLAIPLIPALATGAATGASTLASVWHGLAGLNVTVGAGTALTTGALAIPHGAGITITAQHLVLAGGALTLTNIGTYLATALDDDFERALSEIDGDADRPNVRNPQPFDNDARGGTTQLPTTNSAGEPVTYTEHTVNPRPPGGALDGKRIVTGDDGSVWVTSDHFVTWARVR